MLPIHAALLLGSFVVTASLAVSGLAIARHARSHSDRKAWLLLALAAPSLGVGAMGAVIVPMLWRGCLMFTRFDVHLSLLILAVESALGISALFITYWRARQAAGRLVAIAEPCDDARVRRLLFALCTRMRVALPRVCCVMAERPVAFVTGIFAPRLVLSTWLLAELDDEELEALLAHELVHLRHGDNAFAHLTIALRALSFFLPTSARAYRVLMADRELFSDAVATAVTRKPLALASALVKVARYETCEVPLAAHFADASVTARVERLLAGNDVSCAVGPLTLGAALTAALLLLAALMPFYWMNCASGVSCLTMAM